MKKEKSIIIQKLGHGKLPDPIAQRFAFLERLVVVLERRLIGSGEFNCGAGFETIQKRRQENEPKKIGNIGRPCRAGNP
jgi:hypothetical protein